MTYIPSSFVYDVHLIVAWSFSEMGSSGRRTPEYSSYKNCESHFPELLVTHSFWARIKTLIAFKNIAKFNTRLLLVTNIISGKTPSLRFYAKKFSDYSRWQWARSKVIIKSPHFSSSSYYLVVVVNFLLIILLTPKSTFKKSHEEKKKIVIGKIFNNTPSTHRRTETNIVGNGWVR